MTILILHLRPSIVHPSIVDDIVVRRGVRSWCYTSTLNLSVHCCHSYENYKLYYYCYIDTDWPSFIQFEWTRDDDFAQTLYRGHHRIRDNDTARKNYYDDDHDAREQPTIHDHQLLSTSSHNRESILRVVFRLTAAHVLHQSANDQLA